MRIILVLLTACLLAACANAGDRIEGPPQHDGLRGQHGPDGPLPNGRSLFISPMGEPFRVDRPDRAWFAGTDANADGRINNVEFGADATRFFRVVDRAGDGEIDPGDIGQYEDMLVPEVRVGDSNGPGGSRASGRGGRRSSGGGGPGGGGFGRDPGRSSGVRPADSSANRQGAGRYAYLDLPEPITSADRNFNRGIDAGEFSRAADERFRLLDRNHDGVLTQGELPSVDTRVRSGQGGFGMRLRSDSRSINRDGAETRLSDE